MTGSAPAQPSLLPVSFDEMIAEIRREASWRLAVYPRLAEQKKLSQGSIERRARVLSAIEQLLVELRGQGQRPPSEAAL